MRLLLDEDIDVRLRLRFSKGLEVETVTYRGWKGMRNGALLRLAQQDFEVFVTLDDNIPDQQDLSQYDLAVAILRPRTQSLKDLAELVPELETRLFELRPGEYARIFPRQGN